MATRKQIAADAAAADKKAADKKAAAKKKAAAATPQAQNTPTPRRAPAADPRGAPEPSADSPSPDAAPGRQKLTIVGRLADDSSVANITRASAAEVMATAGDPAAPLSHRAGHRDRRNARNAEMVEVTVARAFKFTDDTHALVDYPAGTYELPRQVAEDTFAVAAGGITAAPARTKK